MKVILKILFGAYFIMTILYVSPDSFVKVKAKNAVTIFGIFFEQRWNFFAPPPQANNRLYYSYYDSIGVSLGTYEVLKPLLVEKQDALPFNTREEVIDYIVNGAISNFIDYLSTHRNMYEYAYPDSSLGAISRMAREEIKEQYNTPSYETLINYGKIVSRKNLKNEYSKIKYQTISLTEIPIPKFINRNELLIRSSNIERLIFTSPKIKIDLVHENQ